MIEHKQMTIEELKLSLSEHNFESYSSFLDFVEQVQRMSAADKYAILKEEYDKEKKKA